MFLMGQFLHRGDKNLAVEIFEFIPASERILWDRKAVIDNPVFVDNADKTKSMTVFAQISSSV